MEDWFDQTNKMMEKIWGPWKEMASKAPWLQKPEVSLSGKWAPWIATMRSTYEANVNLWETLFEHGEDTFFKLFKESSMHTDAMEKQMRDVWEELKKVQHNQEEMTKQLLDRMEELLQGSDEAP